MKTRTVEGHKTQKPFKTLVLGKRDQPESKVGKLNPTDLTVPILIAGCAAGVVALAPGATVATVATTGLTVLGAQLKGLD